MIKPKENDQHVKAVEYSHTLEKLLIMERENSAAIRSELEAAERERDELRKVLQETQVGLIDAINHASQLQAELSRRDAAAGEPDYWQFKSVSGDWIGIGESGMRQAVSEGVEVRPLYTAAPPAVLPPDITFESKGFISLTSEDFAYNRALEDARKLGAQPQKVVELPSNIRTELVNVLTWIERLPVPTASAAAKAIRLRKVISEIDAANVKWEVKK